MSFANLIGNNMAKASSSMAFVKMVDIISTYNSMEHLEVPNIKERFNEYAEKLLQQCSFTRLEHCWIALLPMLCRTISTYPKICYVR